MSDMQTRVKKRTKLPYIFIAVIFSFLLLLSMFILILPSFQRIELNDGEHQAIYYMGEKVDYFSIEQNNQTYLPLKFVQEYIDPTIEWDNEAELAIITTSENVYHFPLGNTEGLLNLEPYSFSYPVIEYQSEIFIPVDPIAKFYNIKLNSIEEKSILIIHDLEKPIQQGVTLSETKLLNQPKTISPWIDKIPSGKNVLILKENNGWYWVETDEGYMGYINKKDVKLTDIRVEEIKKEIYQPWNPIGEPIILTWEYATKKTANPDDIGFLPGVHVVSPTWFHLKEDGLVSNTADIEYVKWAHQNGYQVWGLFSNSFDKELTSEMLNDSKLRIKVIKQLLSYADLYQLDGINLDFENVYLEDKEAYVQFVRELTPLLHEKGRTVSVDVTFKSSSENWSMFYDREKLGQIADYIIVMGYDEHWANSPEAGSVSSLPWVEKGIKGILEDVPSDKVILGVPFYTRLWIEEVDDEGNKSVSSKTFSMDQAQQWIEENNLKVTYDKATGQNYVQLIEGTTTYRVWLEDSTSMEKRFEIMDKYNLAGIGAWRRGFESKDFWDVIAESIN